MPRRTIFETASALSGRIRVVDRGDERRLVVAGQTLSAIPLSGDWSRLEREYWWRALRMVTLPARPTALFVGAGGGTQLAMLSRLACPRWLTVIERDPLILQVAQRYFGLGQVDRAEFLCGDVERVLPAIEAAGRHFSFVMDDATYADPARALPLVVRLAQRVTTRGFFVVNRHARHDAAETAEALRPAFASVTMRRVRRGGENVLICATGKRRT